MTIKYIMLAPPNKAKTKILLRDAKVATSYLDASDDGIENVKDLYFAVTKFMDDVERLDDAFPIVYSYQRKLGYVIRVAEGCAIKWRGEIYCDGDVLGTIPDKEMI